MALKVQGLCPLIQVFDMPTSVRFYRDLLGFEIVNSSPSRSADDFDWCWLHHGDAALMLNTAYEFDSRPPMPNSARATAHEDTCFYIGCPDVDEAYKYFRAKGLNLDEPKVAPYGMKQLYLKDPDGFEICFQWPA
jgi:catechol 2,3-dioxygenase-like lactoylglutathione lyase family enzyme